MSINYVIACWSGMRRVNPKQYVDDRSIFLRKHLKSLYQLKHSIDQITIIVNHNPDEPSSYREYLNNLPNKIGNANVVLIERPNEGFSYGGYSEVFSRYHEQFDYYVLMEDDYMYMVDNFDAIMLKYMQSNSRCGFVSFWMADSSKNEQLGRLNQTKEAKIIKGIHKYFPDTFKFPRISVGLVRSKTLQDIWNTFGALPYSTGANHRECKFIGQFGLSAIMQKLQWILADMLPDCRVIGFGPNGEIVEYGPKDKPLFIAPIQALL